MPVPFACIGTSFWRIAERPADGQFPSGQVRPVTPRFFATLSIPLIAGRDFSDSDTADSTPVAIVSQEVVRREFGDGSRSAGSSESTSITDRSTGIRQLHARIVDAACVRRTRSHCIRSGPLPLTELR